MWVRRATYSKKKLGSIRYVPQKWCLLRKVLIRLYISQVTKLIIVFLLIRCRSPGCPGMILEKPTS